MAGIYNLSLIRIVMKKKMYSKNKLIIYLVTKCRQVHS